jgi:hypothetical protein
MTWGVITTYILFSSRRILYILASSGTASIAHVTLRPFPSDAQTNPAMEPSREKLSAAAVLLLTLLVVAAGTCVLCS